MVHKKEKIICIVLVVLAVIFLILGFLFRGGSDASASLDFRLPEKEKQVVMLPGVTESELGENAAGGGTITYGGEAVYDLKTRKLSFAFENSQAGASDMVISLICDGQELWQSGRISAGEGLAESVDANIRLNPGQYDCILNIDHYDPVTGEKAIFQMTADVNLIVADGLSEDGVATVFFQ